MALAVQVDRSGVDPPGAAGAAVAQVAEFRAEHREDGIGLNKSWVVGVAAARIVAEVLRQHAKIAVAAAVWAAGGAQPWQPASQ